MKGFDEHLGVVQCRKSITAHSMQAARLVDSFGCQGSNVDLINNHGQKNIAHFATEEITRGLRLLYAHVFW